MRTSFINTLSDMAPNDERIILITADVGYTVLERFERLFPDRFFNVGVAEANAVGIAAGLALSGKIPFVYSFIPFIVMRAFEQIRLDAAYMNLNIRLVGIGSGLAYGAEGPTHHAIEDIALMRALPNMTVCCPGDPWETAQVTKASLIQTGPMYIRLGKKGEATINPVDGEFKLGKANVIKQGKDVHIFSTGNTLEIAANVVNELKTQRINASLISLHTLKPLDTDYIVTVLKTEKPIITIEEHSLIGGLGSVLAEIIAESRFNPLFKRYALPDEYTRHVGSQNYLRQQYGLHEKRIMQEIKDLLGAG